MLNDGQKRIVLVVDDNIINRKILCKILQDEYEVIQAENGKEALDILYSKGKNISAILLDLLMPVMGGYEFLERKKACKKKDIVNIPVVVVTQSDSDEVEIESLSKGAMDFLSKPYKPLIIKHRLTNLIQQRESAMFINTVEYDEMTGIYSKEVFYARCAERLQRVDRSTMDMICVDIADLKVINDMFGEGTGDNLLKHVATGIRKILKSDGLCGRVGGDVFGILVYHDQFDLNGFINSLNDYINTFEININVSARYGVYTIVNDNSPVSVLCDKALLAIKNGSARFGSLYFVYDESLREALWNEQIIIGEMNQALAENQFQVYLQAKCDLKTEQVVGAEALVRWIHPVRGFMSPGEFIPVFERNGFITKLDYFVWERACKYLREWIDEGKTPIPISVNVSRVDIYNPNLVDIFKDLIAKYDLEPKLLHLEITETAYTENPQQLIDTIIRLKEVGFHIEMDDFGSGYSSLNMLNEVPVDTLKLDMGFLRSNEVDKSKAHSGNIIYFVVNLAKWLGLSVVAEGIENEEELYFLRSLSCTYGQGYFFSKPVPVRSFEELMAQKGVLIDEGKKKKEKDFISQQEIWEPTSEFNKIFYGYVGPLAILEYDKGELTMLRANDDGYEIIGAERTLVENITENVFKIIHSEDLADFKQCIEEGIKSNQQFVTEARWIDFENNKRWRWINGRCKVISRQEDKVVILMGMEDFTEKYKSRARMKSVIDCAPLGVYTYRTSDTQFGWVSESFANALGYTKAELLKKADNKFINVVSEDNADKVLNSFEEQIQECGRAVVDIGFKTKSGGILTVRSYSVHKLDEYGINWCYCVNIDFDNIKNEILNSVHKED